MLDKGQFPCESVINADAGCCRTSFIHLLWIFSFLKLLNDQYLWGNHLHYKLTKYYQMKVMIIMGVGK
jgi:hypothetical protein